MTNPASSDSCTICGGKLLLYAAYDQGWRVFKCVRCGFGQTNVTEDDINAFYEADYFGGLSARFRQDQEEQIDEARIWWIDNFIRGDDISCVEIGPGSAAMVPKYLARTRPDVRYEAVEVSHFASTHLSENGINVHVGKVYDVDIASLLGNRFDCAVATEVIEHDLHPRRFVGGLYNLLKPGGTACLTTGNFNGLTARWKGRSWYYLDPPAHVCFYTPRSAKLVFTEAGFRDIRIHCVGLNYVRLHRRYPVPGMLKFVDWLQIPTGMTITARK